MKLNRANQAGYVNYIIIAVVVLIIVIAGLFFLLREDEVVKEVAEPVVTESVPILEPEPEAEAVEPDIAVVEAQPFIGQSLPNMEDSDAVVVEVVQEYLNNQSHRLLTDSNILQKIVLQVDNIAQGKIVYRHSPIDAPNELFSVSQERGEITMSAASKQRFDVYANTLNSVNLNNLVEIYEFFKPLLEEAYAELGYSAQEFEPRLKMAIEHVLAAPEVDEVLELTRPTVAYHFKDSKYEKLSMVHKQMLRMGSDNTRKIKAVLRRFLSYL